jgi:hypothetical protein
MLEIGSGGLDRINGIIRRQWKGCDFGKSGC